ncbi:MAG: hypothetical protein AAF449_21280 [Myxococcota bacterium]
MGALEPYYHEVAAGDSVQQIYYGVDRLGVPFNSTYGSAQKTSTYFKDNEEAHQVMASLFSNGENHIQKLQRMLADCHQYGGELAQLHGRQAYSGILRSTHCDRPYKIHQKPHFDAIPSEYLQIERQWGANIYFLRHLHNVCELQFIHSSVAPPPTRLWFSGAKSAV